MQSRTQAVLWAVAGVVWALGQGCASVSQVGLAPLSTLERVKPVRLETPEAVLRHARDVRLARHEVPRFAHRWYPALPVWRGRQRVAHADRVALSAYQAQAGQLDLAGVRTLDRATLEAITAHWCGSIHLPDVQTLTREAAHILADEGCTIALPNLKTLNPTAARALSWNSHTVYVGMERIDHRAAYALSHNRITNLWIKPGQADDAVFRALGTAHGAVLVVEVDALTPSRATALVAKSRIALMVRGLATLTPETARALAIPRLWTLGIFTDRLSPDAARALSTFAEGALVVGGAWTLTDAIAEQLVGLSDNVSLIIDVPNITARAAQRLAARRAPKRMALIGLDRLGVEAARALATTTLPLELGLRSLDASEAEQLAKIPTALTLHQLQELSPEAARALSAYRGPHVRAFGVRVWNRDSVELLKPDKAELAATESLDADSALALGSCSNGCSWRNLRRVDDATLRAMLDTQRHSAFPALAQINLAQAHMLAGARQDRLELGVETLSVPEAEALARFRGQTLVLRRLTKLTPAVARALASWPGRSLTFEGLGELDAATAQALASFRGDFLSVYGLYTLDEDAAQALGGFRGRGLRLGSPHALNPASVWLSISKPGRSARLGRALALDVRSARALCATRPWRVRLPRLERISPDAAAALIACEGTPHRGSASPHRVSDVLLGVRSLTPATARALARVDDTLSLHRLMSLDRSTAAALSEFQGQSLCLPKALLESLPPDVGAALGAAPISPYDCSK